MVSLILQSFSFIIKKLIKMFCNNLYLAIYFLTFRAKYAPSSKKTKKTKKVNCYTLRNKKYLTYVLKVRCYKCPKK